MKKLYILAGPNGAGKTTLSYTILPEIFDCQEYINADEIARGISPFNPDKVKVLAGRIMLKRIRELLDNGESFAFETTLATKTYKELVHKAQQEGYEVILLFLWLESAELAIERVRIRVKEGGHDIPVSTIRRRFINGVSNFFRLYAKIVDKWILINNSNVEIDIIAEGRKEQTVVFNKKSWSDLKELYGKG